MTRPLRIQFEGAWYHVMNRGACRKPIFNSAQQRLLFIDLLAEIVEIYKIEVHAYCLMDNHFHILIRTPFPNLSKTMQHLSALYTIRYNKMEGTDGPLFRGRFKSKLVDDEAYGIHLVRYIHLNPLMAHMTDDIENYKWSSYLAYLGIAEKPGWLTISHTLQNFTQDNYFEEFRAFTHEGNSQAIEKFFSVNKKSPIIGSEIYINKIKTEFSYKNESNEISEKIILRPTLDQIIYEVSYAFKIHPTELMKVKRFSINYARTMAMLIAKRHFSYRLIEIAEFFGIRSYQTVSKLTISLLHKINSDSHLRTIFTEILTKLS